MSEKIKLLIIEHDPNDIELLHFELKDSDIHYDYEIIQNEAGLINSLQTSIPDIILSDFSLPSFSGLEALELCKNLAPLIPFIFVSGNLGDERAVELIKNGATDYVIKDRLVALPYKITRALKESKEKREKLLAEKERIKLTDDLIQRNKDLEQFAYIISHNLRSPVAKIMGLSALLENNKSIPVELSEIVLPLNDSAQRLDEVIRDLNDILNVRTNLGENRETVQFAGLLKEIKLSIKDLIDKEKVTITSDFSGAGEIQTLKSYLYSIFFNLISNSIKYKKPAVAPVIEIKSKRVEDKIVLIFNDNGLGIDLAKNNAKVFGLYKRFHTHTEGKGMGLFMVKTQVESLGGKIEIESKPNEGTTFKIIFQQ